MKWLMPPSITKGALTFQGIEKLLGETKQLL